MRKPPLILISPGTSRSGAEFFDYSVNLSDAYTQAIARAGGIPWIFPANPDPDLIAAAVRRCDGVMLTGGDDLHPGLYDEKLPLKLKRTIGDTDRVRDAVELSLVQEVFTQRKPLLAICRGHQLLNVALGGTMIVDIPLQAPSAINHRRMDLKDSVVHQVSLTEGSLMAKVMDRERIGVNSSHHQAVGELAKPFKVTGQSHDGIVEAYELTDADSQLLPYMLAVQFHPERLVRKYPVFQQLFLSFTSASAHSSNL